MPPNIGGTPYYDPRFDANVGINTIHGPSIARNAVVGLSSQEISVVDELCRVMEPDADDNRRIN